MDYYQIFRGEQERHTEAINALDFESIHRAFLIIRDCLEHDGKLLIFGNGGSAADAQHFAAEIVGKFLERRRALPAIALTTDTSIMTAVANDFGFDEIFARQIEALAKPNDVLVAISTSGTSGNVIKALRFAKNNLPNIAIISLTGIDGGDMEEYSAVTIKASSDKTPIIQECHQFIYHYLCRIIEDCL